MDSPQLTFPLVLGSELHARQYFRFPIRTEPGSDVRVTVTEIVVHVDVPHASVRTVVQVATANNEARTGLYALPCLKS